MFRQCCIWVVLLGWAGSAQASWADALFDELSFDFGSVPRGQLLSHPFRVANNTDKSVTIAGARVSCGCVSTRIMQSTLKPGEETVILAHMDTSRFFGSKTVTVYVHFAQPKFEEVRVWVQANSREDVVFNPEALNFGKIKRGAAPTQAMTVTFYGTPTNVVEAKSDSNYVQVAVKENKANGESSAQIEAKIRADTPAGKWYTDIWLITNNPAMPKLRVPLTVEIEAALSVSPHSVSLGEVKAGAESDRKVMIRGVKPFRITKITGTDAQLQVRASKLESKSVHVLTVTVRPQAVGELSRVIRVHTDLKPGGDIEFHTTATIVP
jgi:hypothetical protein